ncbi:MAG: host attachment protein [Methylococcaceae bacterium]|nr:host attachment protein [Methylococcaceae bacterium]
MKSTWILVADNTRARFFTVATPSAALEEIDTLVHTEGRLHDRDLTSDLPGKIKASGGIGQGHAFEQPTDPKKHETEAFAKLIAAYLNNAHNAHKFEQLMVVAGVSLMGLLRIQYSEAVKKKVYLELSKNIATLSTAEIREHLPKFLPNL